MKRILIDGGLSLLIAIVYLFGMIALRVPFYVIFIIGFALFILGLLGAVFLDKKTRGRRITLLISTVGLLSSLLIWLLVHFLLSRLH